MTGIEPVTSSLPRTRSTKLSYIGTLLNAITTTALDPPAPEWWIGEDSNLRSPKGRRVYSPLLLTAQPPIRFKHPRLAEATSVGAHASTGLPV